MTYKEITISKMQLEGWLYALIHKAQDFMGIAREQHSLHISPIGNMICDSCGCEWPCVAATVTVQ